MSSMSSILWVIWENRKAGKHLWLEVRGSLVGNNVGYSLAQPSDILIMYKLSFFVTVNGRMKGEYVDMWSE